MAIKVSGTGHENIGIYNLNSSNSIIADATVNISGNSGNNYGIAVNNSSSLIRDVRIISVEGINNNEVSNFNSSSLGMFNVTCEASDGTNNYGIYNLDSFAKIDNSSIRGTTNTVRNLGGTVYIDNTKLNGGLVANSGTAKCAAVYDENYDFYPNTCP